MRRYWVPPLRLFIPPARQVRRAFVIGLLALLGALIASLAGLRIPENPSALGTAPLVFGLVATATGFFADLDARLLPRIASTHRDVPNASSHAGGVWALAILVAALAAGYASPVDTSLALLEGLYFGLLAAGVATAFAAGHAARSVLAPYRAQSKVSPAAPGNVEGPIRLPDQDILAREQTVATLVRAANELRDGEGAVLGLEGDWGVGKSSIVALAARRMRARGWLVAHMSGYHFAPREELVRLLGTSIDEALGVEYETRDFLPALLKQFSVAQSLSEKLLGFSLILPAGREKDSPDAARRQLLHLLDGVRRPVVVFVEDVDRLHGSDFLTLAAAIATGGHLPGFVFVLVMDRFAVEGAVSGTGADGAGYLRKILTKSVRVPPGSVETLVAQLSTRVSSVLNRHSTDFSTRDLERRISGDAWLSLAPTLRHIKQLESRFDTALDALLGEVNVMDLLLLTAIDEFVPQVLKEITEKPGKWMTGDRRNPFATLFSNPETEARDLEAFETLSSYQLSAVKSCLDMLFPTNPDRLQLRADQRVAITEYFRTYVERRVSPSRVPDSLIVGQLAITNSLAETDVNHAAEQLVQTLLGMQNVGKLFQFMDHWVAIGDRLSAPAAIATTSAIARLSRDIPEVEGLFVDDPVERSRELIFVLMRSQPAHRRALAESVVDSATSFEFARRFVQHLRRENHQPEFDFSDLDVAALNRRLARRIRAEIEVKGWNPFETEEERRASWILGAVMDRKFAAEFAIVKGQVESVLRGFSRQEAVSGAWTLLMAELCEVFDARLLQRAVEETAGDRSLLQNQLLSTEVPCRDAQLPIRIAREGEPGTELRSYIQTRDPKNASRIEAFILEWSHIQDEAGRAPTSAEFIDYWKRSQKELSGDLDLFHNVFPMEPDPSAVAALMWEGVGSNPSAFTDMMSVSITEAS